MYSNREIEEWKQATSEAYHAINEAINKFENIEVGFVVKLLSGGKASKLKKEIDDIQGKLTAKLAKLKPFVYNI